MSSSYLNKVFTAIGTLTSISIQLLRITNNRDGIRYFTREIEVQPEEVLSEFLSETCTKYTKDSSSAELVDEYAGDIVKGVIYKLSLKDELIAGRCQSLAAVVANPDTECSVEKSRWDALLIKGTIVLGSEEQKVLLVSMRSPISVLTNRFLFSGNDEFKQVKEPVLTLNKTLDAIIVNDTFYMLTMQAENLFAMERSYRLRCDKKVEEVTELGILSNVDAFRSFATKGQNPRRFVSFNQHRLDVLKDMASRKKYMTKFNIAIMDNGAIDTNEEKASERLIKFLCEKAMLDPIDEEPREVSAAKAWS